MIRHFYIIIIITFKRYHNYGKRVKNHKKNWLEEKKLGVVWRQNIL